MRCEEEQRDDLRAGDVTAGSAKAWDSRLSTSIAVESFFQSLLLAPVVMASVYPRLKYCGCRSSHGQSDGRHRNRCNPFPAHRSSFAATPRMYGRGDWQ